MKISYNDNLTDTNGLWMIESETMQYGGLVTIDKKYRLKHTSTGQYLTLKEIVHKPKNFEYSIDKQFEKYKLKLTRNKEGNTL